MFATAPIISPLVVDQDDVVRIGDTRVTLITVINAFNRGATPEEIVQQFPALALADVYATIAYYLQHQVEVDTYLDEQRRAADEIRRANQVPGIRNRLLARRQNTKHESS